ncbi:PepSY-associated TM helix domain-containing protein [Larkinella punicea]|uniref:PepSY domain-containing protein n=1 Tax=Larkinella punicea TaxID=2315727 RepID=A0A368JF40_9BACT|nr:PepSY-associated TM helix domain-containing protein [Larkinella punicea]RCR65676.1 PepSY domain-containing protein [Larkinella punicea]
MKLKGLGNRAYHIMFHTHTVSGIVISVALYIIFFAGAFTLFREEFYQWENPSSRIGVVDHIDYQEIIRKIKIFDPTFLVDKEMRIVPPTEENPLISVYGMVAKPNGKPEYEGFRYNPLTKTVADHEWHESTVGETLFRLHFLDQLPYAGRWIAGFVSLFFLFAVVTGVLVHWRNMLTKFYGFSLKGTRKQLWTNAHTVFGLIGLPFQMMYAVTGAFYLLTLLILLPAVMVLYGGDQQKIFALIRPNEAVKLNENAAITTGNASIESVLNRIKTDYPGYEVHYFTVENLTREDALLSARIVDKKSFTGDGIVSIFMKDGKKAVEVIPGRKKYVESVVDGIARLHFAQFGGLLLKGIYFVLTLFTCFVIISGVLLWKEARNKKGYTEAQKRFHHRVTMMYLAICFGLFPAVPVLFIAELAIPAEVSAHAFQVNTVFFLSWLGFTVIGLFLKTEARQTRLFLLLGGLLSVLVPVVNGIQTGDWLWNPATSRYVLATDFFWLLTGIGTLAIYGSMLKNRQTVLEGKAVKETAII